ncbi:hypothetical protein EV421DRAFT_1714981, partial [Armillaria borealis]
GLDPHQDILVEILQIVLLDFLKYMWHNTIKLSLLETKLNSFDISTLGIKSLNRKTLVQYYGPLTRHDFCSITQVTPFVIYELMD